MKKSTWSWIALPLVEAISRDFNDQLLRILTSQLLPYTPYDTSVLTVDWLMEFQSHPSPMKLHQGILADPLRSPSHGRGTIGLVGKDDHWQLRDCLRLSRWQNMRIDVRLSSEAMKSTWSWIA